MQNITDEQKAAIEAKGLTVKQFHVIADMLCNWEDTPDQEMADCLANEGVQRPVIAEVLALRQQAFSTPVPLLDVVKGRLVIDSAL